MTFDVRGAFQLNWIVKLVLVGLVLSAIGILAWVAYQHRFTINPDGVAYISIAEHYAAGRWQEAVNGYWSPLLSWLMAPLILLGFGGQAAFAIINLGVSIFIVVFGAFLAYQLTQNRLASYVYILAVVPFLITVLAGPITPDSLVVAWVLLFVFVLWKLNKLLDSTVALTARRIAGIALLIGLVGFFGYVTKLYLQPVFVVTLVIFFLARRVFNREKRQNVKEYFVLLAASAATYVILSLIWIVPVSLKYDYPLVSSSYAFNSGPRNLPMTRMLIETPHERAVTNWEDPTYLTKYKSIDPPSGSQVKQSLPGKLYDSTPKYIELINNLWGLFFASIIGVGAILATTRKFNKEHKFLAIILLTSSVYMGGYLLQGISRNQRYIWPLAVLSLLLCAYLVAYSWGRVRRSGVRWRQVVLILIALSIPLFSYFRYTPHPKEYLRVRTTPPIELVAKEIESQRILPKGSVIASNNWANSMYIAYFLNLHSYGVIKPGDNFDSTVSQRALQNKEVAYYIDFTAGERSYINGTELYSREIAGRFCGLEAENGCRLTIFKL